MVGFTEYEMRGACEVDFFNAGEDGRWVAEQQLAAELFDQFCDRHIHALSL
jgi:hypothetical protein